MTSRARDAPLLHVSDLSKHFRLRPARANLMRSIAAGFTRAPRRPERVALQGIDFALARGEALGVLGANGAGKTTLLKVICGIYPPTTGSVRCQGIVLPLFQWGLGFQPELDVMENLMLYGALVGIPRLALREQADDILDAAGLLRFPNTRVEHLSSGMQARLAFSIAMRARADLLVLDEVFSVGDLAFQNACGERLRGRREEGTAILLASHNLSLIEKECDRVLYLREGRMAALGPSGPTIARYRSDAGAGGE
ncbi:MAG: ABC transporter ATP-binding protein [Planctomycetes bacterium]|nr:ABC transporter ATP-binding protein [Planctomycetota bacterium]